MFGTDTLWTDTSTFYKQTTYQKMQQKYDNLDMYNSLYSIHLEASSTTIKSVVTPGNFIEILAIMGGFVSVMTKFIGWSLRNYQAFQFRKSSIKKLYFYSRTKKKEPLGPTANPSTLVKKELKEKKKFEDEEKYSHKTLSISDGSDFNEKLIRSQTKGDENANLEIPEQDNLYLKATPNSVLKDGREMQRHTMKINQAIKQSQDQQLKDIVYSKTVLSFGYKSFLNYYYKLLCFNCISFIGNLCQCHDLTNRCKVRKSSMTARKYKRAKNAQKKISEEIDLIEIVKTLRAARFIINSQMTPKQQQCIDYFKEYSLETPSIHQSQQQIKYPRK